MNKNKKPGRAARAAGCTAKLAVDRVAARRGTGMLDRVNGGEVKTYLLALLAKQPQLTAHHLRALAADRFPMLKLAGRVKPLPPIRTFQHALKAWRREYRNELLAILDPDGLKSKVRFAARVAVPATRLNEVWQICARRLGMLQNLKTWPTFGKGWSARVANVKAIGQAWASGSVGPAPVKVSIAKAYGDVAAANANDRLAMQRLPIGFEVAGCFMVGLGSQARLHRFQVGIHDLAECVGGVQAGLGLGVRWVFATCGQSQQPFGLSTCFFWRPRRAVHPIRWYDRYREGGIEALADRRSRPDRVWNRIPDDIRGQIIDLALEVPELSPRELAVRFTDERKYFVSEASVYRLLKAHDLITSPIYVVVKAANEFKDKTTALNQLWQTDFTYLKITGWGWYYLSTVLDDFSRYIVAWRRGPTMCASDVTATLDRALAASGLDHVNLRQRPRLLSDNGSSYVAEDLGTWLKGKDMSHVHGAPYHPQTQGKIERWHQTLKSRILLENYYLPGDLEQQINAFVEHYNHIRYHESIGNLTPADVYFGRAETILAERQRIKRVTIANRLLQHRLQAA